MRVLGGEYQSIRVLEMASSSAKENIPGWLKLDPSFSLQSKEPRGFHLVETNRRARRVDCLWILTEEAEHHGPVGAMTSSGSSE